MRKFALLVALVLVASGAQAATLNVVDGQLMGASGVNVDGNLYDVQFLDGTCIGLYNGCDEISDFTFQTEASALLASQALLDQVFLDSPEGMFDSNPPLTNGCGFSGPAACQAITPHSFSGAPSPDFSAEDAVSSGIAHNVGGPLNPLVMDQAFSDHRSVISRSEYYGYGNAPGPPTNATFARWQLVPEPSTALLLGIGLTGLAAKGRRRNRS